MENYAYYVQIFAFSSRPCDKDKIFIHTSQSINYRFLEYKFCMVSLWCLMGMLNEDMSESEVVHYHCQSASIAL